MSSLNDKNIDKFDQYDILKIKQTIIIKFLEVIMKKYKQFTVGFLIGSVLFSTLGVFATNELGLTIKLNQYPIFFNGEQVAVEGYNINDYTYMKLGDIGKVLKIPVVFNQTNGHIEIARVTENITVTQGVYETEQIDKVDIKTLNPYEQSRNKNVEKTSDGLPIVYIDGGQYVPTRYIGSKYNQYVKPDKYSGKQLAVGYTTKINKDNDTLSLYKKDLTQLENIKKDKSMRSASKAKAIHKIQEGDILINNIPFTTYTDSEDVLHYYIPYNYYTQNVLPLLK